MEYKHHHNPKENGGHQGHPRRVPPSHRERELRDRPHLVLRDRYERDVDNCGQGREDGGEDGKDEREDRHAVLPGKHREREGDEIKDGDNWVEYEDEEEAFEGDLDYGRVSYEREHVVVDVVSQHWLGAFAMVREYGRNVQKPFPYQSINSS